MKKGLRNCLIATVIGISAQLAANAKEAEAKPQFSVCVRNYAGVSTATLSRAEQIAQRLYRFAGVETTWADYVPPSTGIRDTDAEATICGSSMPRMIVNLVDHEIGSDHNFRHTVLGVAPGDAQELNRNFVYVFMQVANRIAQEEQKADEAQVLGHAMAHELGHILAHVDKHSSTGLMRAIWGEKDFEAMTIAGLNFNPEQAACIRREINRRTDELTVSLVAAISH